MPGDDAAWVARCPGWALWLLRFASPLSDRHIGAAQGGRGRGTLAKVWGGCGRHGGRSRRTAGQQLLAIASLTPCWEARVCRGRVVGAGGWCGQLLSRERSRELRQGRAAGLSSQVSVSWVMGLAGFQPPPCPSSPAGVGKGGSRVQAARGAAKRGCNPALTLQGCAE